MALPTLDMLTPYSFSSVCSCFLSNCTQSSGDQVYIASCGNKHFRPSLVDYLNLSQTIPLTSGNSKVLNAHKKEASPNLSSDYEQ
eukprot:1631303-Amphidinium_carterae.1